MLHSPVLLYIVVIAGLLAVGRLHGGVSRARRWPLPRKSLYERKRREGRARPCAWINLHVNRLNAG